MGINKSAQGGYLTIGSEEFYKIAGYDAMKPFFISLASNCDIWMFVSSNGALTAGRKKAELALFPYETEDKILASADTGPKTLVRMKNTDGSFRVWEPFSTDLLNQFNIERNLYKNIAGNSLIFEEINRTLEMSFQYRWSLSEKFGLVRTSTVTNLSGKTAELEVLDGLLNILPYGIPVIIQESKSCLADAYKGAELDEATGLVYYYLTTVIADRPEPSEMLKTNIVWNTRSEKSRILLSADQMKDFVAGNAVRTEKTAYGRRSAYLLSFPLRLNAGSGDSWKIVAEVGLGQSGASAIRKMLLENKSRNQLAADIDADVARCTAELEKIVSAADGMQVTNDRKASVHHQVNVLYNNMRGGAFLDNYDFHYDEFLSFIETRNKAVAKEQKAFFEQFRENHTIPFLKEKAFATGDPDIIRLCMEFLPLSFSRRHGDPSRPWNHFYIGSKDPSGRWTYNYQGNWRDIFQNWEAMTLSFPEYLDNIIVKFLNASTVDGFNPYRISQEGIDWEVTEPSDPWASIGYWGDHQIIYLLKLLEALEEHGSDRMDRLFRNEIFCYADVPYEIKPYHEIVKNAKSTIVFNHDRHKKTVTRAKHDGSDARLVYRGKGIYHVHLVEKLIIPVLSKLSNLVVDGGIWMNTQRPEWNDANNAIVGNGLSMVTAYYLRRHLNFLSGMLKKYGNEKVPFSAEAAGWLNSVLSIFTRNAGRIREGNVNGAFRKELLDQLGEAFSTYREKVYHKGFSSKKPLPVGTVLELIHVSMLYIDRTIEKNLDSGHLFNAYNIFSFSPDHKELTLSGLYPMLEGQTSALSSGKLSVKETVAVLKSMKNSGLYNPSQHSYYLYPVRQLPGYLEKNIIPPERIRTIPLLETLLQDNDCSVVCCDADGNARFSSDFYNVHDLVHVLKQHGSTEKYATLVRKWSGAVVELYEEIFRHKEFTGRSGVMFKYEGIGCIYWHQNSKLLLAIQDIYYNAVANGESPESLGELKEEYYVVRAGLGFNKEPSEWGAFPFDPYSHTPSFAGAQQPGMTGQVKEEILTRRRELGITVKGGSVVFMPDLLRKEEFLNAGAIFRFWNLEGKEEVLELPPSSLAFTVCQVPVIYQLAQKDEIQVTDSKGTSIYAGNTLNRDISGQIFLRKGVIRKIHVLLDGKKIR